MRLETATGWTTYFANNELVCTRYWNPSQKRKMIDDVWPTSGIEEMKR